MATLSLARLPFDPHDVRMLAEQIAHELPDSLRSQPLSARFVREANVEQRRDAFKVFDDDEADELALNSGGENLIVRAVEIPFLPARVKALAGGRRVHVEGKCVRRHEANKLLPPARIDKRERFDVYGHACMLSAAVEHPPADPGEKGAPKKNEDEWRPPSPNRLSG